MTSKVRVIKNVCRALPVAVVIWLSVAGGGCNIRFGDPAVSINYDNRRSEAVRITYLEDIEGAIWLQGESIPPQSQKHVYVMKRGKGVRIRAAIPSGAIVHDQYYRWDEFPKGETLTIVIE